MSSYVTDGDEPAKALETKKKPIGPRLFIKPGGSATRGCLTVILWQRQALCQMSPFRLFHQSWGGWGLDTVRTYVALVILDVPF